MPESLSENRKVLYLSYDGITDPLGQSQILPYLKRLCQYGYTFFMLGFEKKQAYKQEGITIRNEIRGFNIVWIPCRYHKWPPVFSTLFDLYLMHRKATKLCKEKKIIIVHCRSYLPMLIGLMLKTRFRIKLLFDMRGFWADERVDGRIWNLKNPIFNWIYKYFKRKEIQFTTQADHIISLTYAGKEEMTSGRLFRNNNVKISEEKITVIPCAVDTELFDPEAVSQEAVNQWKERLNITVEDKVLIYLGSLGTWYMLEEMLIYFKELIEHQPGYKFLFVTKDEMSEAFWLAERLGLDPTKILSKSASRTEVPELLMMADLGIFFIKPVYSKKASSATKMGEMMAMGLPFVTNKGVGDGDDLVQKYGNGVSIDLNQFENCRKNLDHLDKISDRQSSIIEEFWLNNCVAEYRKVYKEVDT
ncbi:MAG: glycosyltransferase [Cyclobacteriaceae bacterium]